MSNPGRWARLVEDGGARSKMERPPTKLLEVSTLVLHFYVGVVIM
jgi:hypothetical protein